MLWSWILVSFILTFIFTPSIMRLAERFEILDKPLLDRKIHARAVPLLGGLGIYLTILAVTVFAILFTDRLTMGEISAMHYIGFLIGGAILMIGGALDDKFDLSPKITILFPIAAAFSAILGGIEVSKLTNPLGGIIHLESWMSDLLVFVWLIAVMYTTKLLDGLDGLVASVTSVGALAIMLLSLTLAFFQPDVALFSSIGLGALLGFLVWNWHPALVFLGEGGSTFAGFFLGTLAVISGGKVAIALLVIGIPLLDFIWVVLRRVSSKQSFAKADRKHLHHRFFDLGWPQSRIAALYTGIAIIFGITALFLQSKEKLFALVVLVGLMIIAASLLVRHEKNTSTK